LSRICNLQKIDEKTASSPIASEVAEMKVAYKELFRLTVRAFLGVILAAAFVYAVLWAQKTITYAYLYKGLVEQTIAEMVKSEYLK
jgi:hypothetical protein